MQLRADICRWQLEAPPPLRHPAVKYSLRPSTDSVAQDFYTRTAVRFNTMPSYVMTSTLYRPKSLCRNCNRCTESW